MISDQTYKVISENAERLNSAIIYDRDFKYNFFGFKTLERSYLLKINGKVAERPQHLVMRVVVGIHGSDIDAAIEIYNLMSERYFTHAGPTLFNASTPCPQLSYCFLLTMKKDSTEGIYDTLKICAQISKTAGGIGLNIHNIRASGSYITGSNGHSNGLLPMLKVFKNTARYVDQGGNKHPSAFAMYLEPWHADVFTFLDLRISVKMKLELEICFMRFGFLVCLCNVWCIMMNGPCSVPTKHLVFAKYMVMNLLHYLKSTKKKAEQEKPSRLKSFGVLSWKLKLRRAILLCSIKMLVTERVIIRIWVLSNVVTCVQRLFNTLVLMKSQFVILLPSLYLRLLLTEINSISKNFMMLSRSLLKV